MSDRKAGDPLVGLEGFRHVLEPLSGKKVMYVRAHENLALMAYGNTGDTLIDMATLYLFGKFGVSVVDDPRECDFLVWPGGGNLGSSYMPELSVMTMMYELAREHGKKIVVLPQTAMKVEAFPDSVIRVFARDKTTLGMIRGSVLAPDMAMGYPSPIGIEPPQQGSGLFYRGDSESVRSAGMAGSIDPDAVCRHRPEGYYRMAMGFRSIRTDRLHFAIAAMTVGRNVTLLPNSYHKNRSMYETWLKDFGCDWNESV